jgi:hypothetical protein
MKRIKQKNQERGMAMLVAMFTLVLLSVIGLGLMYSTNMETIINANYRDKQVAMYGAMSGLQEARDRLQPAAPAMPLPTDMPTLTNHQVFYIINPKNGETVAPWDLTNKYKDTELCQEGILDLTPTPGIPCNELPMGDDWYTIIDNSSDASEPWKSSTPLDTKWIRVTMKGNNMTPVVASGDAGVSTETCWDGSHQILKPNGYGPDCGPDGSIVKVTVTSGGIGYTSPPTVTFSTPPAGGTQATGTAVIASLPTGQLSSVTVNTPGAGYTTAPTVSFVGTGTGATATAVIVPPGSSVNSLTLNDAGAQCYAVPPTVSFSGGGSGATAVATLGFPSCIAGWTVTGSCHARRGTTVAGVGLSGASGSDFSGSITFKTGAGAVIATSIQNPGTGYTSNPTNLTDLTGCGSLTVTAIAGSLIDSVTLSSGGAGYTSTPTVNIASGAGADVAPPSATATIGAAVAGGTLSAINLNNPGTGYTTAPLVVLTGGGVGVTTIATATASIATTNTVTGITLDDPGLGYTYNPTVTFSGGGGTGAAATANRANGSDYGRVFLVTAMSQTKSGAKAMAQAELASPVSGAWFPGALTLNGPNPTMAAMPNSNVFYVDGNDFSNDPAHGGCTEDPEDPRPAIGGFDDPNADPPTNSVDVIVDAIPTGRYDHYVGTGGEPSVVNIYGTLGETMSSPTGLKSLIDAVAAAPGAHVYGNDPSSISMGSAASPAINFIDGDLTLAGTTNGYGVLVVTGKLIGSGAFHWHGIILVVGDGEMEYQGGGFPEIDGTVFVSKIWDDHTTKNLLPSLGSPSMDWNGGGGNGIYYNHCWVENLIPIIPFTPPPSTRPLKVLSTRTVSY